jgi:TRAP-type C4-dicarboxylate transport system permease large subunit
MNLQDNILFIGAVGAGIIFGISISLALYPLARKRIEKRIERQSWNEASNFFRRRYNLQD